MKKLSPKKKVESEKKTEYIMQLTVTAQMHCTGFDRLCRKMAEVKLRESGQLF